MKSFSKEYLDYWEKTSKALTNYVEKRRDNDVEQLINQLLSFFAFSTEDLSSKVTRNNADLNKLNAYVIISIDSLRSLLRCQEELSLVGIALIQRTAFEIHCNLKYMLTHSSPSQMIDRNLRFMDVEKFKHAQQSGSVVTLSSAEESAIKAKCPEWFDAAGKLRKDNFHWTAEVGKNLREISKSIGLEDQYISLYSTNSKIVHGSSMAINLYKDDKGMPHFNGKPEHCSRMSILACNYWLNTFEVYCKFFGISLNQNDLDITKNNLLVAIKKY